MLNEFLTKKTRYTPRERASRGSSTTENLVCAGAIGDGEEDEALGMGCPMVKLLHK